MSEEREPAARPARGGFWKRAWKPLVAVVLLALVASNVPWDDRLFVGSDPEQIEIEGRIDGKWRDAQIVFEIDAEQAAALPIDFGSQPVVNGRLRLELDRETPPAWSAGRSIDWRPGLLKIFRGMDPRGILTTFAFLALGFGFAITRWWRFLRLAGCPTTWASTFRLTFLGMFFNLLIPGLTGGDVVKAVMCVRDHPERRADALISVVIDRLLGLFALLLLAAVAIFLSGEGFAELRLAVVLAVAVGAVGLWMLLHPTPRRLIRLDVLLKRLPQRERLSKLDHALRTYAAHPGQLAVGFGISVLNHFTTFLAVHSLVRAFGAELSLIEVAGIVAIANSLTALPIAPGGWGVGEAAFGAMFTLIGAPATLGVAVSVTYRMCMVIIGLAGGLFLLVPGSGQAQVSWARREAERVAGAGD